MDPVRLTIATYDMEHHVRRSIVSTIYGGTSGVQREIFGRAYGL